LNKKIDWRFPIRKKSLKNKQTHDTNLESYRCPKCKHIIKIENKLIQNKVISCPNCGQKNIFKKPPEQQGKKYRKTHKNKGWLFQLVFNAMIIALIINLTSLPIVFQLNPYVTKMILTLIIIGIIVSLFMTEKKQNISLKITFGTIIYILLLFLATGTDLEIFLILIFLGLLIIRTIVDEYLPPLLKMRMNLFISAFFIIFIVIVIKRIINLVGI
jgi:DNA-directed RNA polymerase subunit RPC12/RpoP